MDDLQFVESIFHGALGVNSAQLLATIQNIIFKFDDINLRQLHDAVVLELTTCKDLRSLHASVIERMNADPDKWRREFYESICNAVMCGILNVSHLAELKDETTFFKRAFIPLPIPCKTYYAIITINECGIASPAHGDFMFSKGSVLLPCDQHGYLIPEIHFGQRVSVFLPLEYAWGSIHVKTNWSHSHYLNSDARFFREYSKTWSSTTSIGAVNASFDECCREVNKLVDALKERNSVLAQSFKAEIPSESN